VTLAVAPRALVGRRLRVTWDDGAAYAGRVVAYDAATQHHKVGRGGGDAAAGARPLALTQARKGGW
jgi:hypothetical protein